MSIVSPELAGETPYIWRARQPQSRHRLICFPHAGAGATAYAEWAALLPPEIELVAVQLPGRQDRIAEEPFSEVGPLVSVLTHALRPVLGGSYSFFGHSCGAALAFELAKALRAKGQTGPEHLFLSAQAAPGATGIRQLHDLSDDEFRDAMLTLGGIDEEIANDEFVMDSLVPVLRADFSLWERHRTAPEAPLDCPITVLAGEEDPQAPKDSLDGWRDQTNAEFTLRFYSGGHFYFLDSPGIVVSAIAEKVLGAVAGRTA
ncbi:thioesterase II family protein [Streptomyces spectabilis]|uniref:Medium-chain acyl-[acyl-carrier-protein] hydrolase n=1 Tax=Streptomyces spectabilis TaxID=68270 RepID=A0A5P2XGQ5_STRST|nr:alpha/beta fold hydrolase [Streptomyces spectabilis]MBB5105184.1 medium-chain acyl-[acyl-carrier-protein] hydrolase [Streptomyces spectabilis]MCI3905910.1 alpha/beta fold hydrolase [Streptomyces spectabilis]QEV62824.1 thioesterase [Streptomyces spectabilis]GGV05935.1 thioesterase [Streptomyces spectabilis]